MTGSVEAVFEQPVFWVDCDCGVGTDVQLDLARISSRVPPFSEWRPRFCPNCGSPVRGRKERVL